MKPATLFPDWDDDIRDPGDDWKTGSAGSQSGESIHSKQLPPIVLPNSSRLTPVGRTATSRSAARRVRPKAESQAARIWDYIQQQGDDGATDKEIQAALELDGNSQRPRRVWLRDNGFIDQKPDTLRNGCIVWIAVKPFVVQDRQLTAGQSHRFMSI